MSNHTKVWHNGNLVDPEDTKVSLLAHGFSRASAIFDVFSVYPGPDGPMAFRMDEHLDRLTSSATTLEMNIPYSREKIVEGCVQTVEANNLEKGLIKIMAYWGSEEVIALVPDDPLDVTIFSIPESPGLLLNKYTPMTACFSKWRKLNPVTVPTNAKACANYLNGYLARKDGFNKGFDLGIMLDTNGLLAEGSIEAVFIVKNGVLKVPPLGQVLKSISRHSIVQAVPYAGIPIIETAITKDDVLDADEIFAAHSIDRVMPIKQFGERKLAAPGPVTLKVINLIKDIFDYKIEKFMDWFLPLK